MTTKLHFTLVVNTIYYRSFGEMMYRHLALGETTKYIYIYMEKIITCIHYKDEHNLSTPTEIYGKICVASVVHLMKKS